MFTVGPRATNGVNRLWSQPQSAGYSDPMPASDIRVYGDPVLRQRAIEVADVTGAVVDLTKRMIETMYDAPGLGLAAPQIGVQKRLFVYDLQDGTGAKVIVNPVITESRGEWSYDEGCLSVPGLSWEIVRPKEIHLTGFDLEGAEVSIEADELLARLYQHELDHLDGTLLVDHLDDDTRKLAMKAIREKMLAGTFSLARKPDIDPVEAVNKRGRRIPGLSLPGLD